MGLIWERTDTRIGSMTDDNHPTDNVEYLGVSTTLPIPTERVLQAALGRGLDSVLIIGKYGEAGGYETYYASSHSDMREWVWDMEVLKNQIFNGEFEV